jgi:hypothetical protein
VLAYLDRAWGFLVAIAHIHPAFVELALDILHVSVEFGDVPPRGRLLVVIAGQRRRSSRTSRARRPAYHRARPSVPLGEMTGDHMADQLYYVVVSPPTPTHEIIVCTLASSPQDAERKARDHLGKGAVGAVRVSVSERGLVSIRIPLIQPLTDG